MNLAEVFAIAAQRLKEDPGIDLVEITHAGATYFLERSPVFGHHSGGSPGGSQTFTITKKEKP